MSKNAKRRARLEEAVEKFCIDWYGAKQRDLSEVTDEDLIFYLKRCGFTAADILDPEIRSWVHEIDAQIRSLEETEETTEKGPEIEPLAATEIGDLPEKRGEAA